MAFLLLCEWLLSVEKTAKAAEVRKALPPTLRILAAFAVEF
jgi:hypothetical protein